MIIFDELKHAEDIIKHGHKNERNITYDNIILVKYWRYRGLNEDEIKKQLKYIMTDFKYLFNRNILEHKIRKAVKIGMKHDLVTGTIVEITDKDIEAINFLPTIELKKIMFVLLVVWKFKKLSRFVISNRDLMQLSKVNVSYGTLCNYLHQIIKTKMLNVEVYKGKLHYRIHIDSGDNVILRISNFDNLVYYYLQLLEPDKYKECENCGAIIRITSNRKKYCRKCWKIKEQERQRTKWHRYKCNYQKTTALEKPENPHE